MYSQLNCNNCNKSKKISINCTNDICKECCINKESICLFHKKKSKMLYCIKRGLICNIITELREEKYDFTNENDIKSEIYNRINDSNSKEIVEYIDNFFKYLKNNDSDIFLF